MDKVQKKNKKSSAFTKYWSEFATELQILWKKKFVFQKHKVCNSWIKASKVHV